MKPSTAKYWLNFYTHAQSILFARWSDGGGLVLLCSGQALLLTVGGMFIGMITSTEKLTDIQGWELYGALNALPLTCFLGYWIFKIIYSLVAGLGYATEQKLKDVAAKPEPLPNYEAEQGGELSFPEKRQPKTIEVVR